MKSLPPMLERGPRQRARTAADDNRDYKCAVLAHLADVLDLAEIDFFPDPTEYGITDRQADAVRRSLARTFRTRAKRGGYVR